MKNLARKQNLDVQQLALLASEMDKKKRSTGTAYVLLFFLSVFGIHQFYLKNTKRAAMFLATQCGSIFCGMLYWSSLVSMVFSKAPGARAKEVVGLFVITFIMGFIGVLLWLYDVVTLTKQTEQANENIEAELLTHIQA